MKSPYVRELEANQTITTTFLVQTKEIRQKKSGEPYLSLVLCDRTGDIDAKMWDNVSDVLSAFERDDFVKVRGLIQIYQNRPQLTIHRLAKVDEREVDFSDYFPASTRDPEEMFQELCGIIDGLTNPHLKGLLQALMADEEVAAKFKIAPAAKSIHHAWLGGLIEHVLSLCGLAKLVAPHYPFIDGDLLLTGIVLHDIGKIDELTYTRSFGYSNNGQLLGHIMIALRMVSDKLRNLPDFPEKLRNLVEHMIISHHGELEFGSPKVPLFAEAMLLHHLDNLDSKMETMRGLVAKDSHVDGCWTGWSSALERVVLKKEKYLTAVEDVSGHAVPQAGSSVKASVSASAATVPSTPPPSAPPQQRSQSTLFGDKLLGALNRKDT